MNKQGESKVLMTVLTFTVIALAVGILYWLFVPGAQQPPLITEKSIITTTTGEKISATTGQKVIVCDNDKKDAIKSRYINTLATPITYLSAVPVYLYGGRGTSSILPFISVGNTSSTNGDFDTSAQQIQCDPVTETKYSAGTITVRDTASSSDKIEAVDANGNTISVSEISSLGNDVVLSFLGAAIKPVQVKFYDPESRAWFMTNTSATGGTNWQVPATGVIMNITDTGGSTSLVVGQGDYYRFDMFSIANATDTQYGETGRKNYLCVDLTTTSVWQEPDVYVGGSSTKLSDVKASLPPEATTVLSNYEYCYSIPSPITDIETAISVKHWAKSDQNPGTSDQPVWRMCAEGRYKSNDKTDKLLIDCYQDDSSNTEVATVFPVIFKVITS